jgi:MFS family permease
MHLSSGPSTLFLSLMTAAASLPFFLFTFPAGALADLSDRRALLIATYFWLASAAGLLAVLCWLHLVHRYKLLITAFLLGTGFAFNAPVWACLVPEIVRKEEFASAMTLGAVQFNLAGIVGPALGGLLLAIAGPAAVFTLNAAAFVGVAWVIFRCYQTKRRPNPIPENFLKSFVSALRYVRYTPRMQIILTRDFLFGLFIAAVPALTPVVALRHLRLTGSQLGFVFTAMGIGSLVGANLILPYARAKATPNSLTILAGALLVPVLVLLANVQNLLSLLPLVALAGVSWTVSACELWIAGQRTMPDWARGRMNALHMMASQGGVAIGAIIWGTAAASWGLRATLAGGALLFTVSLASAIPLSIDFTHVLALDRAPLKTTHEFPLAPKMQDGPLTITTELVIRPQDREEFITLTKDLRLIFLRNGALLYRVDEIVERPGTFRTEMRVHSWAEHLRQYARMTKTETELVERVQAMHSAEQKPAIVYTFGSAPQTVRALFGKASSATRERRDQGGNS